MQFSEESNVKLSKISIDVWDSFEEKFGVDIQYRKAGYLLLAREEETASQFKKDVAMQNRLGVPSELLTPEEAEKHCPELNSDLYRLATFCPVDGFTDPYLALQGYAKAAQDIGVDVRTNSEVTNVLREGDTIRGVETRQNDLKADFVVNATGAWARRFAELAGISIPVAPRRRQPSLVVPEKPVSELHSLVSDLDTGMYFRPERDGHAIVGGHFGDHDKDVHPDTYSKGVDYNLAATAIEQASECANHFGPESELKKGWAGLYAVTPDHNPILEETIPGFINAVGFSGHGFQHAPATGKIVADLVEKGSTDLVDISPFQSDRFEDISLDTEQNMI
ncbi:FAD-dependent oxidoreductase [Haloferax sp. ATB1]|uniref:NAD(P)/FAD-dependent oxidoreductase n=1 Tax=Haloferax sp. ATB1 TaxID=1508454 RepID=UPI000A5566DE